MTIFRIAALFAALAGVLPAQDQPLRPKAKAALKQKQLQQQRQAAALERFLTLPPQQQRRLLQQMAPERRRQALALLDAWNLLSDDERSSLRGRVESFTTLAPDRQRAMRQEIRILRLMTPEDRRKRLADIKPRFSEDEMQILYGVAGNSDAQE